MTLLYMGVGFLLIDSGNYIFGWFMYMYGGILTTFNILKMLRRE